MPVSDSNVLTYSPTPSPAQTDLSGRIQWIILTLILLANIALKLPNLGHASLKPMDESFHAVVARNLLYDPFKPTLIREPYLPYDPTDWLNNHVWLHKPVLPLWIIALSFKLLGVSAFALRLPSLILCTGAILWTFLIARKLYGPVPALIASAMQAIVPTIGMIVHGYVFSDAIDINLLFWSELSLVLMLHGRTRKWIALSGAAAGAAFMSKTFPALFTLAPLILIAVVKASSLSLYSGRGQGRGAAPSDSISSTGSEEPSPQPSPCVQGEGVGSIIRIIVLWMFAFLLIAAPWNIYCAIRFPIEFKAEYGLILTHLSADVENWASPWDRLWFQHLPSALYHFWTTCLVGSVVLTIRAIQLKKWEWLFVPIWIASVLIPFTLATSKTPSATLIAWPALMIGGGFLISRAAQGYIVELSTTIALLLAMIFFRGSLIAKGWGETAPFEILKQAQWIGWHLAIGLTVMGASLASDRRLKGPSCAVLALAVAIGFGWLGWGTGKTAWKVQSIPDNRRAFQDVGKWIDANLPTNALICTTEVDFLNSPGRRNSILFYSNRPLVGAAPDRAREVAITRQGRVLYLLDTGGVLESPTPIYISRQDYCRVYAVPPVKP